ncbi:MAG: hypothetical protein N2595_04915, partial [bacterium]|nr:hypothetical protein [bacterium]
MTARERIVGTLERKRVDRVPVDIWYVGEVLEELYAYTKTGNEREMWRVLGVDKWAWVNPAYVGELAPKSAEASFVNHWGVQFKMVQSGQATYGEAVVRPLEGYTAETIKDYPYWPDPDKFDYAGMEKQVKELANEFATLGPWVSLFEIYCLMRGIEQALVDVALEPELVHRALDKIEEVQTGMLENVLARTRGELDAVFVSDDMGSQQGLLMSPGMWEEFIKPRFERWCKLIHAYGVRVFHHTDGAVRELIPRYIELGVDKWAWV